MCNIPNLSTQLNLLLTLRELPISMNDLQPVSLLDHLQSQIKGQIRRQAVWQSALFLQAETNW